MVPGTFSAKAGEVPRRWFIVDAEGKILGRLATQVAMAIRGKNKPQFTPSLDAGDFVIVTNAAKVRVTGKKLDDKLYHRHTGFLGGLKTRTLREWMQRNPSEVIRMAVWGMLPKGKLGRRLIHKLKVYPGPEHPHAAQQPAPLPEPKLFRPKKAKPPEGTKAVA